MIRSVAGPPAPAVEIAREPLLLAKTFVDLPYDRRLSDASLPYSMACEMAACMDQPLA